MRVLLDRPVVMTIAGYASLKGLSIAMVALAFTSSFPDALVIAVVSGSLGVIGMVLAAWVSARAYQQKLRPELRDVKRKLEVARPADDQEAEDD